MREMELNYPAFKEFKDEGVKIITLPSETQKEIKKLMDIVYDEEAAKDPFFKKILESQRKFHKEWVEYTDYYKITY
ncbi:hypothetical protein ES705_41103 [subsurface metagenome]